jgi:hypothetical protein
MPFSYTVNEPVSETIAQVEIVDFTVDLARREIHYTVELHNEANEVLRERIYTITPDFFVATLTAVEDYDVTETVYSSIKKALYDDYARQTGKTGAVV